MAQVDRFQAARKEEGIVISVERTVIDENGTTTTSVGNFVLNDANAVKLMNSLVSTEETIIDVHAGQVRIYKDSADSAYHVIELIDLSAAAGLVRTICQHDGEQNSLAHQLKWAIEIKDPEFHEQMEIRKWFQNKGYKVSDNVMSEIVETKDGLVNVPGRKYLTATPDLGDSITIQLEQGETFIQGLERLKAKVSQTIR